VLVVPLDFGPGKYPTTPVPDCTGWIVYSLLGLTLASVFMEEEDLSPRLPVLANCRSRITFATPDDMGDLEKDIRETKSSELHFVRHQVLPKHSHSVYEISCGDSPKSRDNITMIIDALTRSNRDSVPFVLEVKTSMRAAAYEESSFARLWRQVVGQPLIPFHPDERARLMAQIKKRNTHVGEHMDYWQERVAD
jgi:hypothetical protein